MAASPATIASIAQTHIASLQQLQDDYDAAKTDIDDLRAEISRLTAQVQLLDAELTRVRARGTYYEHYSVALVSKLYDVGHIIDLAIAEAREKGHNTTPSPLHRDDQSRLEEIAAKLQPEAQEETMP